MTEVLGSETPEITRDGKRSREEFTEEEPEREAKRLHTENEEYIDILKEDGENEPMLLDDDNNNNVNHQEDDQNTANSNNGAPTENVGEDVQFVNDEDQQKQNELDRKLLEEQLRKLEEMETQLLNEKPVINKTPQNSSLSKETASPNNGTTNHVNNSNNNTNNTNNNNQHKTPASSLATSSTPATTSSNSSTNKAPETSSTPAKTTPKKRGRTSAAGSTSAGRGRKPKKETSEPPAKKPKTAASSGSNNNIEKRQLRPANNRKLNNKYVPRDKPVEEVKLGFEMKQCQTTLRALFKQRLVWPFVEPVDPVELNIPDYFDIITHPMDLGTIKENLESGEYSNADEFADDVRLVWRNALTYNPPDSDVVFMTKQMSDFFEKKFAQTKKRIQEKRGSKPSVEESNPAAKEILELKKTVNSVQEELNRLKESNPKPANTRKKGGAQPVDENKDMTFEEKKKLTTDMNSLDEDQLDNVAKIIRDRMPQLCQNDEGDIMTIEIEALDTPTLRHLERYIKSLQTPKRSRSRSKKATNSTSTGNGSNSNGGGNTNKLVDSDLQTQQKIADMEADLKKLTDKAKAITQRGLARSAGLLVEEDKPSTPAPKKEESKVAPVLSDSESDSESESSDSDSSESGKAS
eukprot:TRINITY_DN1226_c0_g1_i2.p1 TRINITY_DN1226_c0_g1~~TRINITY_DN1226_c0_g1_i2.p1  ORF type:complete len:635 (-),score=196.30 TRINITY_DN1226_c0_g1_i2:87-1991(-)